MLLRHYRSSLSLSRCAPRQDACSFFVNPFTAYGIADTAKSLGGGKGFVHTGAASQLGQMLVQLCGAG